jgi:hypothetical protein
MQPIVSVYIFLNFFLLEWPTLQQLMDHVVTMVVFSSLKCLIITNLPT